MSKNETTLCCCFGTKPGYPCRICRGSAVTMYNGMSEEQRRIRNEQALFRRSVRDGPIRPATDGVTVPEIIMTLYQQLKDAGVPLDHHESDLYAQVTPESTKIIEAHSCHASTFRDIKGYPWYDLVGMYQPFWDAREAATDANSPQAQA